jgi:hypothetical protein
MPPRLTVGDPGNINRAVAVQVRLQELGKLYRKRVHKKNRSYRAWLEFLAAHESLLVNTDAATNEARYKAAPKG